MQNIANKNLGKKFTNCVYAVCEIAPEYSDILLKYGNPLSKKFNRDKALLRSKEKIREISEPVNGALACFIDSRGLFVHVGLYLNGYVYHYLETHGLFAVDSDIILSTTDYIELKYYISEDIK